MSCKVYDFLVKKSYNKQELTYIIEIMDWLKSIGGQLQGWPLLFLSPKKRIGNKIIVIYLYKQV